MADESKDKSGWSLGPLIKVDLNLSTVGEAAKALIERVADHFGAKREPALIVERAQAQSEAEIIAAETRVKVSDIERRAQLRWVKDETRRQRNIESVVRLALPDVKEDARPQDIDDDWLAHFFDRSRLVGDEQMQTLWGRILAGESNAPSTFSKRTLEAVSLLEKSDATLFTSLCQFCWTFADGVPKLIMPFEEDALCVSRGVGIETLTHFDSIGLVHYESLGYQLEPMDAPFRAEYFHRYVVLKSGRLDFFAGRVSLTKTGQQLARISGATYAEDIFEHWVARWRDEQRLQTFG